MSKDAKHIRLPLSARLVKAYIRSNLRGRSRLPVFLARNLKTFRFVPVQFTDRPPVYVDLRFDMADYLLSGSPWENSPFEVDEQLVMKKLVRPGETALDIGANFGLYTTLLSQLVGPSGKVCVFEPNPDLVRLLEKTVGALENASLFPFALSDQSGESILYVPNDHSMGSLVDYTSDPDLVTWRMEIGLTSAEVIRCELKTMDELFSSEMIPYPSFIKCDVEGAELKVFQGGRTILNQAHAPIIMFECREECAQGFGFRKFAALEFLSSLPQARYEFFEVKQGGNLLPLNQDDCASPNLLAVPHTQLDRIQSLNAPQNTE